MHPGKWAVPGGKLEWNQLDLSKPTRMNGDVIDFEDAVEELLSREVKEEAGIEIEGKLHYITSVAFVRPGGIPVVLLKFAALYKLGEVIPEAGAFTDLAWVDAEEVMNFDCILGVREEVKQTVELFSKYL